MLRQREISELIIEQAVDAFILVGPDAEIVYQNAEARRLFGYSDDEVLGHTINQILHHRYPDSSYVPPDHCKVHRAVHYGEVTRDFIWALYRKDGGTVHAACTAWPLMAEGAKWGAVFFARHITERKTQKNQPGAAAKSCKWLLMSPVSVSMITTLSKMSCAGERHTETALRLATAPLYPLIHFLPVCIQTTASDCGMNINVLMIPQAAAR